MRLRQLCLLLMLAAPMVNATRPATAQAGRPTPGVPRRAPNFVRLDLNHRKVELSAYRGKVVLLNFWATWCGPCLTEMPHFATWQQEYRERGLQVIGISMDDDAQPVRAAYQKLKLNYPVVMGDEKIGEMYGGVLGLPVTFLIDTKGKIRHKHQGAADIKTIESEIRGLLAAHGTSSRP